MSHYSYLLDGVSHAPTVVEPQTTGVLEHGHDGVVPHVKSVEVIPGQNRVSICKHATRLLIVPEVV